MKILAISGSLRRVSSNTALLRAAATLAPPGVTVVLYPDLGELPHFNPDFEADPPAAAKSLRAQVAAADGLLICSPEYAHGVPGSLKNALDWLVGGPEFVNKPVALFNASPRATHAQAALAETVTTMSGCLITEACVAVPLLGRNLDEAGMVADRQIAGTVRAALAVFTKAIAEVASGGGA